MKQYKHKITGDLATESKDKGYYEVNFKPTRLLPTKIPAEMVENTQDWERVDKSRYHIVELIKGNVLKTVKRLSDGQVFTIGDNITSHYNKYLFIEIASIIIDEQYAMGLKFKGTNGLIISLEAAGKVGKLFTTEDGVDIFQNDRYFTVSNQNNKYPWTIAGLYINPKAQEPTGDIKYFSARKKAEEYIVLNKPCLSINDLKGWMEVSGLFYFGINEIKELVKSKLKG